MSRQILNVLLLLALLLQGVSAVGADFSSDPSQEQHCAGHAALPEDCRCCPEGATTMSCAAQCSAAQAPLAMVAPIRVVTYAVRFAFAAPLLTSAQHAPPVPPPIL